MNLIEQSENLNIKNLSTGYWPMLSINGQGSYQSEVTKINIPIPGIKIPTQSKDQYKAYGDVSQLVYDGGLITEQKKILLKNSDVEKSKVNVELNDLKTRISDLYFRVLYQQELSGQVNLLLKNIQLGIDKVKPQVENRSVLRSNLLVLEAQQLQTQQRNIEIAHTKKGLLNALATLLKTTIDENTILEKPVIDFPVDTTVNRPELELFNNQVNLIQMRTKLIEARNKPKISAFAQGGYGRPALNLFSTKFDPYYIAGVRANWSIGSLYTSKRDKQLLEIDQKTVNLQKETFLLNTQSQLIIQRSEINKYIELIAADENIIEVRQKISEAAKAQLENMVITTNDYLREINAEDQARQNLIIHQIQLLQAKAVYAITAGKL
jgi:outer membrane protein TolC